MLRFYDTRGEGKSLQRKENLRLAFNSPSVLSSWQPRPLDKRTGFPLLLQKNCALEPAFQPGCVGAARGTDQPVQVSCHTSKHCQKYGSRKFDKDIWREMFEFANKEEKRTCVPGGTFWCLPDHDKMIKIERIVPMYPLSKDQVSMNG